MAIPARTDGLAIPRRHWSALAIWLALAMSVLDSSIANVALPTIAAELNASPAASIWIVNAYQLAITVLLLPLAAMGDRLGYRRVYLSGLAIFTAGSLGCALAQSLPALVAARVFQGTGAAALMSISAALIRATYPARMLGRGLGYNALVLSISAVTGPTLAALIFEIASWPWLFAINLPIGLLAMAIGLRALPAIPGRGGAPDRASAALCALAFGLVVFGGERLATGGAGLGVAALAAGAIAGAMLVARSRGRPAPLFPVDLLRIPIFALSICTSIASFAAQMLAFVTIPFFLQHILGRSIVETGLLMTPWPLAVGIVAPIAGKLADRYPSGLLGAVGLGVVAIGLSALAMLGPNPSSADIAWRMALCGFGFGLFQSPNNRTIIGVAPWSRSGAAGGMLATARVFGQTSGAIAAAAGFHWLGVGSGSVLLSVAAGTALIAAATSLSRLRFAQPALVSGDLIDDDMSELMLR